MSRAKIVVLLGAESTGKTTLATELGTALQARGQRTAVVPEVLREFCDRLGRTPRQSEQQGIADEQTRRIAAAARTHDIVIADTSAIMIAVYSDFVFGDTSLYAQACIDHATSALTLLTALDLPWQADALQRDGAHVREPVDARIRAALQGAGLPFSVVCGSGVARGQAALACVDAMLAPAQMAPITGAGQAGPTDAPHRWAAWCDRCGDAQCELHLFRKTG